MITYPLSAPANRNPSRVLLRAQSVVGQTRSTFTKERQVQVHQGQAWELEVSLPAMVRSDAEQWITFLLKLNGMEGTFLFGDPNAETPQGIATGTPLVNGASQTGNSLITDGWTVSVTGILKAGDYIQLGSGSTTRLHKVLNDADSDAGGNATLDIWPRLRVSPADNDLIITSAAKGLFALAANNMEWDIEGAMRYGISFTAIEDL